jgi:hypothetical protein
MEGLAIYGAAVGTISLVWNIASQVRSRRPSLTVAFFIKQEREGQERPAWAVIRVVNRSQRDVTITEYSLRGGDWYAVDPPVTVPAFGAVHDVSIPLDEFFSRTDDQQLGGSRMAVRLSTGEVFNAEHE